MMQSNVEEAFRELGTTANLMRFEDPDRIARRGVVATPARVIQVGCRPEAGCPAWPGIGQPMTGPDRSHTKRCGERWPRGKHHERATSFIEPSAL